MAEEEDDVDSNNGAKANVVVGNETAATRMADTPNFMITNVVYKNAYRQTASS